MTILALDLGNRQTKIKSKNNEKVFPSYYYKVRELGNRDLLSGINADQSTEDYVTARDSEEIYAWGEQLNAASPAIVETIGGTDRYSKRKFKILADIAIAKASSYIEGNAHEVTIVTGVPTSDYNNEQTLSDLSKTLKGMHSVTIAGKPHSVNVTDAVVLPQPVGTIINEITDADGNIVDSTLAEGIVGVVDIGGGTVLIDSVNQLALMDKGREQLNTGATKLFEDIKKEVERRNPITVAQVEAILRHSENGEYRYSPNVRDSVDISAIVMQKRRAFTRDIVEKVSATYRNLGAIQAILFTGGASNLLVAEEIYEELDRELVRFVADPEVANVRGFYKFALAQGMANDE